MLVREFAIARPAGEEHDELAIWPRNDDGFVSKHRPGDVLAHIDSACARRCRMHDATVVYPRPDSAVPRHLAYPHMVQTVGAEEDSRAP